MTDLSEKIQELSEESWEKAGESFRKEDLRTRKKEEAKEDAERLEKENKVKRKKIRNRCIFLTMLDCMAPQCSPELCSNCPHHFLYCSSLVVKEAYQKIISFSVILAQQEEQFSLLLSHSHSDPHGGPAPPPHVS